MKFKSPHLSRQSIASALVITLVFLVLLTIIVVGYMSSVTFESNAARSALNEQKAHDMAILAMHTGIAQLRDGLGTGTNSWDNPFGNFMGTRSFTALTTPASVVGGNPPSFFWSISPGLLTRWDYTSDTYAHLPAANKIPLFSGSSGGTSPTVNLNRSKSDGSYPIIGGTNPPPVNVQWVNVLSDPSQPAGSTNKLVGRYAFWIDDENAKININTADGTNKTNLKASLGCGTPTEVSLQVLSENGSSMPVATATNIVQIARTSGFHSPREILRAPGTTPDLYTNNVFNLTCYSRAPELNIFGEPKMNLLPVSPLGLAYTGTQGYLYQNDITTQPLTEIYPTPSQLGAFTVYDTRLGWRSTPWQPIVMALNYDANGSKDYPSSDVAFWNMDLISLYLGGTNSMGKAIQWPVFPMAPGTTGSNGFIGKYSLRQLDSISVQIADLGEKSITPEEPNCAYMPANGLTVNTVPLVWSGLLSNQFVSGMGRSAKVNEVLINVTTFGPTLTDTVPHPEMQFSIYLELYFPAGFGGVDLFNLFNAGFQSSELPPAATSVANPNLTYGLGAGSGVYTEALNVLDMPNGVSPNNGLAAPLNGPGVNKAGPSPCVPVYSNSNGSLTGSSCCSVYTRESAVDSNITYSCWQDTILQNNAGIDMFGNPASVGGTTSGSTIPAPDPDQFRAQKYHQFAATTGTNPVLYLPALQPPHSPNSIYAPALRMGDLSINTGPNSTANGSGTVKWFPGQYRTITNYSNGLYYQMKPGVTTLTFSGGLIVTGFSGEVSDPDPTPLEAAVRGGKSPTYTTNFNDYDGQSLSSPAWAQMPNNPAQTTQPTDGSKTLRQRLAPAASSTTGTTDSAGTIPVNLTVNVPASSALLGSSGWYDVQVADPLVNKFPGDWVVEQNVMQTGSYNMPSARGSYTSGYNGWNQASSDPTLTYRDPDSFWMPTLDQTIPRSARMSNIGYLQYLRTGIIPDDETVPLSQQKGIPFRLLNFAPSTDPTQEGATTPYRASSSYSYPDWAILDLFTIPSTLIPFGGPYGYFDHTNGWKPGSMMNGNPSTMRAYSTSGGSTPGRINPNGAVIYTTDVNVAASDTNGNLITRTLPLQAVLHGLMVNQTIATGNDSVSAPTFTGGTAVDEVAISQAIAQYISTDGPLRMPAEICNIPALSALYPDGSDKIHKNRTRNDLVRQIIGNLTTQSNTFSVWVAGQSVQKIRGHTNYGQFETGDNVLSEVRYHFIVERYLDPGAYGVYGNTASPGNDRTVGTYDDPVAATNHPSNPCYLYRVIFSEEIF